MKRVLVIALASFAVAAPAAADDFAGHRESRAFWQKDQPWPNPRAQADKAAPSKFTMTYTEGIARRFGMGSGHMDLFERKLGGRDGPGLVGTVDNGAAKLELRWHPGE